MSTIANSINFSKQLLMGAKADEIKAKLKKGEVEVSEEISQYEPALITIQKAELVQKGDLSHPLLDSPNVDADQVFLYLTVKVEFMDGKTKELENMIGGFLTRAGAVACYPSSPDGKIAGSLLYDVVHSAKEQSPEQKKKFSKKNWQSGLPDNLVGVKFSLPVKVTQGRDGGEYTLFQTSYQKKKDDEYAKQQDTSVTRESSDDLPF